MANEQNLKPVRSKKEARERRQKRWNKKWRGKTSQKDIKRRINMFIRAKGNTEKDKYIFN